MNVFIPKGNIVLLYRYNFLVFTGVSPSLKRLSKKILSVSLRDYIRPLVPVTQPLGKCYSFIRLCLLVLSSERLVIIGTGWAGYTLTQSIDKVRSKSISHLFLPPIDQV